MVASFLFLLFTLYVAQMGDKTQILTLLLATRTKKHIELFFAIMVGFAIGVTIAVVLGIGLSQFIPHTTLETLSGLVFVIIGIIFLRHTPKDKVQEGILSGNSFMSVAILIFLTDLGDKTQIAITLLSTDYSPIIVWLAAMGSLGIDTILMIFFSRAILKRINEKTVKKVAGIIFIMYGVYVLVTHLLG